MRSHKLRHALAVLLSTAVLASCGDSSTKSGSAPLPGEGEAFPFQVNITASDLTGGGSATVTFDQPLVMDSIQGNIVQVTTVTVGANGGAAFNTNSVSFFVAGSGTLDLFAAAVLEANDVVSGTASIDDPTGPFSYPIS